MLADGLLLNELGAKRGTGNAWRRQKTPHCRRGFPAHSWERGSPDLKGDTAIRGTTGKKVSNKLEGSALPVRDILDSMLQQARSLVSKVQRRYIIDRVMSIAGDPAADGHLPFGMEHVAFEDVPAWRT